MRMTIVALLKWVMGLACILWLVDLLLLDLVDPSMIFGYVTLGTFGVMLILEARGSDGNTRPGLVAMGGLFILAVLGAIAYDIWMAFRS